MAADEDWADTLFDVGTAGRPDPEMGTSFPAVNGGTPGNPDPEMGIGNPGNGGAPAGQAEPRNGHISPRQGAGLPYAFDWSITRGVTAVDPDGHTWHDATLKSLIRCIPAGSVVVGESTFDSYDLDARRHVIEYAESRNVTLLTVPARGNTRRRSAAGFPEKTTQNKKTDEEDARAIQFAAVNGAHLKKPALVDAQWADLRDRARRRFIHLRWSKQKDDYARNRMRDLPPFMLMPLERRIALGKIEDQRLTTWNPIIIAAVGVAAEFVSGRADFERLTGLYAHGYPSQFRSDLIYWGWTKQPVKRERIRLTVYRRELRWLFRQFKQNAYPPTEETGTT